VSGSPIRVLVVDDDFRVAGLHASYVDSLPDFEVVGRAHTGADALRAAEELAPDLVVLDEYLPDGNGSALIGRLGAAVIMVSAASDAGVVRRALAAGAINYLLKPFPPTELLDRLQAFRRFWTMLEGGAQADQTAVDRALQALRSGDSPVASVRKGRSAVTSESISDVLRRSEESVTALEVAEATGVSRATAQRYLSDLARDGRVRLTLRYGTTGRPEHRFEWVG
jgi:response regulator of citrate/malate metabolism